MSELLPQIVVQRIVSGGQTGVDRGALDAALSLGIAHGGWCPRGRLAEDGRVPRRYALRETDSSAYWVRTEQNVVDSDATLILYEGELSGGTELTWRMTRKHDRPALRVDLHEPPLTPGIRRWLIEEQIAVLNVAGPRESSSPGIAAQTQLLLEAVFASE